MVITFKKLTLANFKNHAALEIEFGDITNIQGRNGAGKSSIGDAVTWLLYGTDIMGNKLEPKPIGETDVETKVELLLQVDDKQILLGRSQKKTAKYYINEVPEKATKFNELVSSLFDKDLFLSLFNPTYFFTQHWQEQRKQLLQYVSEPLNKEVLAAMSKIRANELELQLKKHSLDDIEKIHRERYRKRDTEYVRASERVKTLTEQLEKYGDSVSDISALQAELKSLQEKRFKIDEGLLPQREAQLKRAGLEKDIEIVKQNILRQKEIAAQIQAEPIQEHCHTCGQPLNEEAIEKVKANKSARLKKEVEIGKRMVEQYNALVEQLKQMPVVEVQPIDTTELDARILELKGQIQQHSQVEQLKREIEAAKQNLEVIRQERNDSLALIDAVKEFRSKQAELMVQKVDKLFEKISVRLYEEQKNGELRDTFEIEMDGKPYSKLSTAEKIKCGLELIEVLSKQSGVIAPTFVDNAESIISFTKPSGQLIVARVVDTDFEIKTVSLKEEVVNE
jgi:DNA repair exonuclease SbcCD ATPase subunit